jgi:hypothetical protein
VQSLGHSEFVIAATRTVIEASSLARPIGGATILLLE